MTDILAEFAEDTKVNEHVEIMRGPVPFAINDVTVGTCSVTREEVLDYKTKQPTGEKLVYLVVQPSQGRAQKIRLKHAVGALEALGFIGDDEPEAAPAPVSAPAPEPEAKPEAKAKK